MSYTQIGDGATENKEKIQQGSVGCIGIMLAPAIAAVVIASQYDEDTSPCGLDDDYTVDLVTFLNCAGYITIAYAAIICCLTCIGRVSENDCTAVAGCPGCLVGLFNIAWAGVGLYMYTNEMSDDCQQTDIGTMIYAWSLIIYVSMALVCCCACFFAVCGAAILGLN